MRKPLDMFVPAKINRDSNHVWLKHYNRGSLVVLRQY